MTTVPVDLHHKFRVEEQQEHAPLNTAWTAGLLALAGVAVAAMWIAVFFIGLPYLANLAR